jgi:hypothetical protein
MSQDPNNYWEQLERLEKLIRASELKAGVVFSFHGLILGLFIDRLEQFRPMFVEHNIFIVLAMLWMICIIISIFFCFKCFNPQIESKYDKNVFFFRDAVNAFGSIEDYTKKLMEVCASPEELFVVLGQQIHVESKIITQKFISVQKAIKYFAFSFVFAIAAIIVWIIRLYL